MKHLATAAFVLMTALGSFAQETIWKFDPAHTKVRFTSTHMMVSEVEGEFNKFDMNVKTKGDDFSNAMIDATIDVNSINTDNEMRDKHLKSDDFFNAEKFPSMIFKAKSFTKVDAKNYIMKGDLTIRDVTKPIEMKVVYNGTVNDPWGNVRAGFKASGKVNRLQYGLKWNMMAEKIAVVSDEIAITLNVELIKDKGTSNLK